VTFIVSKTGQISLLETGIFITGLWIGKDFVVLEKIGIKTFHNI